MFAKRAKFYTTACLLLLITTITTARGKAKSTTTWTPPAATKIAHLLGWVPYLNNQHLCRGYYQELPIIIQNSCIADATAWQADRAVLWQTKPSRAHGHVTVTQTGRQLTGNTLIMYPSKTSKQPAKWDVYGNVHLREPGMLAIGSKANVNMQKKTATLHHAIFRYQGTSSHRQSVYDAQHQRRTINIKGKTLRGNAVQIDQVKPTLIILRDVSITTCDPFSNVWRLKASSLKLNKTTGIGIAHHARLLIHGVPIFYTPYLRLPIDNQRRSGFLIPSFSTSTQSGITLNFPYYWNIAPNIDMTITPNYYSQRGLRTSSWFRYLNHLGSGQIYASLIPGDKRFAAFKSDVAAGRKYSGTDPKHEQQKNTLASNSTNRYQLAWVDNTQYNRYLASNIAINYVSDDYYLQDFSNGFTTASSNDPYGNLVQTTQLTQLANLNLALPHWTINTEVENFQTLHPITLGKDIPKDQYARLPSINIDADYPNALLGLNYNLDTQITNFQHPLLEGDFPTNLPSVTGMRYHTAASVNTYLGRTWGYLKPQVILEGTVYHLRNPVTSLQQQPSMHRVVPIYDIDAGLYFDRNIQFGKTNYRQTLEPRLFYLNVPYVQQNDLPLFDTQANSGLTYARLFDINRFQGLDRIGDANQLTVGITSRLIQNSSGEDIFDVSLGQIFYLRDREVQANQTNPPPALSKADTAHVSPIVGAINWQFLTHWHATSNFAYDTNNHGMKNADVGLNYQTNNQHIFNISYSLTSDKNDVKKQAAKFGVSWPLSRRWQALAGIHYNISDRNIPTYLYGMQYRSCCWAVRLLTSRRDVGVQSDGTTRKYDNTIYLQFSLTGLMSIGNHNGSSSSDILKYVIPGYQDNFGKERLFN